MDCSVNPSRFKHTHTCTATGKRGNFIREETRKCCSCMIFHLLHVTLCICFFWAETNGPKSRTVFSTAWFHKHLQPQIPEHTHITAEVSIFFSFLLPEIHILWDNFSCCWFSIKYFLYYDSLKHFLLYCWFSSSVKTAPISYMRGRLDWILCNWILCRQTGWKSLY